MFGSKKKESKPMAKPTAKSSGYRNNMFSLGTVIKGELSIESEARIEGKVIGTINSKSKLAIGTTGVVEGDIDCKTAWIEGYVSGTLHVEEILVISKSARIEGDIVTQRLIVEEGANISSGNLRAGSMSTERKGIEKDLVHPKLKKEA